MRFGGGKKRLAGAQPRRSGRLLRQGRDPLKQDQPYGILAMLAFGLFVLGTVIGFAFGTDRQIRGGLLRQRAEAQGRPDWVVIDNLPRYVPDTFVAVTQPSLLTTGQFRPEEDGSTIARELVQQVHLLPNSLAGEARGLVMGPVLDRRTSDRALIELYLNRVYLGRAKGYPVYGIFHAAREYFDKDPNELTLGEAATLAGLLLEPRIHDPEMRIGAVGTRRNEVLRVLLRGGAITQEQLEQAMSEPLGFQLGLDQMPFSRPATWGSEPTVIRLPPNLRPTPPDSSAESP